MQITFYKTDDNDNVINKTLTDDVTIPLYLKGQFDVINPILIMSNASGIDFRKYNYAVISDFDRLYFVRNVTQVNAKIYQLYLECDVLETFKHDILECNARFKRGVKDGDTQQQNTVKEVNKKFTIYKSNVSIDYSKQNIILTTVGKTK